MVDLVLLPLADAFMQVGVFVALMVGVFGLVQTRTGDRLTRFLSARGRSGPLVGALLGVTPGCGGAIVVMPLYLQGTVSFGTVVAALVATMGDASFVLIAADPGLALTLHLVLLVCGVLTGYATDAAGLRPRLRPAPHPEAAVVGSAPSDAGGDLDASTGPRPPVWFFWLVALVGLVVSTPVVFGLVDAADLTAWLGVDVYLVVGLLGAGAALAVHLRSRASCAGGSLHAVLQRGAGETAFVTVWVGVAYLVTTWVVELGQVNLATIVAGTGLLGVLAGAAVGLVPGCAVQVILTGLYATGGVPLPTLMANALSQDGDALFPLVMMDRPSAVLATAVTTLPGVVVGAGLLLLL